MGKKKGGGLIIIIFFLNHPTSTKLYRSYYLHRSRDSLSPVCGIFLKGYICKPLSFQRSLQLIWALFKEKIFCGNQCLKKIIWRIRRKRRIFLMNQLIDPNDVCRASPWVCPGSVHTLWWPDIINTVFKPQPESKKML